MSLYFTRNSFVKIMKQSKLDNHWKPGGTEWPLYHSNELFSCEHPRLRIQESNQRVSSSCVNVWTLNHWTNVQSCTSLTSNDPRYRVTILKCFQRVTSLYSSQLNCTGHSSSLEIQKFPVEARIKWLSEASRFPMANLDQLIITVKSSDLHNTILQNRFLMGTSVSMIIYNPTTWDLTICNKWNYISRLLNPTCSSIKDRIDLPDYKGALLCCITNWLNFII